MPMLKTPLFLGATALLALTGCQNAVESEPNIKAPPATVVGEAVSCIDSSRIDRSTVYDDYTIDFTMRGGKTYRNTLSNRCPGLGFNRAFTYSTNINSLCNTDTITVLQNGNNLGVTCGLSDFVPVKLK
ncbi:DUF6491 family protein [Altericroceibacterium indicum]|nr:DUF6491 family protein [Altericroceibacterium indicum]